jgi:hypothetical protein
VAHRHFQVSLALAGIALIAVGGCAGAAQERVAAEPWCRAGGARSLDKAPGDVGPSSEVNERFHEAYQRARAEACRQEESRGLIIRYAFGTVEARWNGKDLGPPVVLFTPYVHALKAVSHSVFLAALLSAEPPGTERDGHVAAALRDVEALRAELGDPSSPAAMLFPADQRPRQMNILALTAAAVLALRDQRFDEGARRDYFSAVRAPLAENLREASAAVLTLLHRTVQSYKRQVDAADPNAWASVVVVAAVAHQARAREVAVQYFERMLGEAVSEGASGEDRLVVVENQPSAADQRGALAAHEVDREHASAIFGDASRLQSDVMADSGGMLDRLLPSAPHAERTR